MSNNLAEKQRKRRLVDSLCVVAVSILGLFLAVPRIGLKSVIEAFSGHTHLFFIVLASMIKVVFNGYERICSRRKKQMTVTK